MAAGLMEILGILGVPLPNYYVRAKISEEGALDSTSGSPSQKLQVPTEAALVGSFEIAPCWGQLRPMIHRSILPIIRSILSHGPKESSTIERFLVP